MENTYYAYSQVLKFIIFVSRQVEQFHKENTYKCLNTYKLLYVLQIGRLSISQDSSGYSSKYITLNASEY